MKETVYPKGTLLFSKGEEADSFFVVVDGQVEVFDPDLSYSVAVIGPGGTFGEQAVFAYGTRNLSVRAIEDCHCLEHSAVDLRMLLGQQEGIVKRAFEMIILQLEMHNALRAMGSKATF